MSRQENDREDLLRQATALVRRAEILPSDTKEGITFGFRRDGGFAVFFGADPVHQFNPQGELRRSFANDLLYKAEQGTLIELRRERSATETVLLRRSLARDEQAEFLESVANRMQVLASVIESRRFTLVGSIPPGEEVIEETLCWLHNHPHCSLAATPNASRR